jgi:glycosyltransferase involved in cell wall biosynthesis
MEKVEQSLLRESIRGARVVPNGVDLSVFRPAERRLARASLGLPQDSRILLFAANKGRTNIWKDYATLETAVTKIAQILPQRLVLICLGGGTGVEHRAGADLCFLPYEKDPRIVANYYQAADVYVHASRADTFPCSVLEALASGTPVIASDVGGIPEQIKGLRDVNEQCPAFNRYPADEATGALVPVGDVDSMAVTVARFLREPALRRQLAVNARRDAQERFDAKQQAEAYLAWYRELAEGVSDAQSAPAGYFEGGRSGCDETGRILVHGGAK